MGSREQALIREFPNGETHLRFLLFQEFFSCAHGMGKDFEWRTVRAKWATLANASRSDARSECDAELMRGASKSLLLD